MNINHRLYIPNKGITSLATFFETWEGNPDEITYLSCYNNELTDLIGCPPNVKTIVCNGNRLTSLEGCPENLEILSCSKNQLTSLANCPKNLRALSCQNNRLTSLQGCPENLEYLLCSYNPITNLQGCPQRLKSLTINSCHLTTLQGCPGTLTELLCGYNRLTTLEGCPAWISGNPMTLVFSGNPLLKEWDLPYDKLREKLELQRFKRGVEIVNRVSQWKWRVVRRFCDNLLEKWYAPDENGVAPYAVWSYRKFQQEINVL